MKKLYFLCMALLMFSPSSGALIPAINGDDPEEIVIEQQGAEGPNGIQSITIRAYKTSSELNISITGYSGSLLLCVGGIGGTILDNNDVNGSALLSLDISPLSSGSYTITIIAGNTYSGHFLQ